MSLGDEFEQNLTTVCTKVLQDITSNQRFLVAIAGPPASGKSHFARALVDKFNNQSSTNAESAALVAMDGYHLDNRILSKRGLLDKKGAPNTFDAYGFCGTVKELKTASRDVYLPTFDREADIVVGNSDCVAAKTQIIVAEGNYLLLNEEPWSNFQSVFDLSVFLRTDISVLRNRLVSRWLNHGLTASQARERSEKNDLANAEIVLNNSVHADITIV